MNKICRSEVSFPSHLTLTQEAGPKKPNQLNVLGGTMPKAK